ncbi:MAG: ABC transporter permease [Acidobacteriota bacterium]
MNAILNEFRLSLRTLIRRWRTTALVVLTLALGIGANTVIFSFVDGILLEPPPYPEPDRLVRIESLRGGETGQISLRDKLDLQERLEIFEDVAAHGLGSSGYNLSGVGRPEMVSSVLCTQNLFSVLGVDLALGTPWPEEGDRLRNHSVVLGYDLWQQRWDGDEEVLDEILSLDGADLYGIYGVTPRNFGYPFGQQIYRSLAYYNLDYEDRGARYYLGLGRLESGVSLAQARDELGRIGRDLAREFPDSNAGLTFQLTPLADTYAGEARPYLLLLLGAVGFVLALACANVANLLMVQALGQGRVTALRRALGASGWQIIRLWLIQGLLRGLAGGALALVIAHFGLGLLRRLLGVDLPDWMVITLDQRVLLFTLGISILVGLITALLPAWQAARGDLLSGLGASSRGSSAGRGWRSARGALVVAQVAITVVLLIGASLMVQSFRSLQQTDLGFRSDSLLTFRVNLGWMAYQERELTRNYYRQLMDQLSALPGVVGVATNSNLPLGDAPDRITVTLEGQSVDEQQRNPFINRKVVSPSYFDVMGVNLVAGRLPDDRDPQDGPPVTVISRHAAEMLFPNESPIGRQIKFGRTTAPMPWMEVVGIVENVQSDEVGGSLGVDIYVSLFQRPNHNAFVLVRTETDPMILSRQAEEIALSIDPNQSTWEYVAMETKIAESLWQQRLSGTLVSLFALLAAVLAAVGIYGVLSQMVRRRRREIGIRMALGAQGGDVVRSVLLESGRWVLAGVILGLTAAFLLGRLIQSLLYGTSAADPLTFVVVPLALVLVTLVASWAPARQAVKVDPVNVLHEG